MCLLHSFKYSRPSKDPDSSLNHHVFRECAELEICNNNNNNNNNYNNNNNNNKCIFNKAPLVAEVIQRRC